MIIGIEGALGSGKTILMVRYLLKDYTNGNKVYANFGLRGIDYEQLNVLEMMEDSTLQDISIGIDEMTVFLDCRKSGSKMNRLISYFILQTRKRNVNLYYTTQSLSMIDIRLVNHTHFQVLCETPRDKFGQDIPNLRKYTVFDCRDVRNIGIRRFFLDISKFYDFYDTNEVILPPL